MIRKVKTLGLAMVAALAMSAFVASAAQAQFTASGATWATATSGKGNDVFSTEGGNVECAAHYSAKVATSTTAITVTASYYECKAFGFAEATVINGCDYVFHSNEEVDLECPSTNKLVVLAGTCEMQIGSQTGLKSVALTNGSGDITVKAGMTGLKYNVTKDGVGCPFNGTGERTSGEHSQTNATTLQSTSGASITVDSEESPPPGEIFTANSYPTTFTATSPLGNDIIVVDGTSQECSTHFEGGFSEPSPSLTITPTYTNCKAFGFASATFNMNGCDYVVHADGEFDVECPSGKAIVITAGNCEVQIGTQTGLESVALSNDGSHIDMQLSISSLTVNVTKDGFLCTLNGTGQKNANYVQEEPVTIEPVSGGNGITLD